MTQRSWAGAVCFFLGALLALLAWRHAGEAAASGTTAAAEAAGGGRPSTG